MPRKFRLLWDKSNKVWYKRDHDGKKVYFGAGRSKYRDDKGYTEAIEKYEGWLKTQTRKTTRKIRKEQERIDNRGFHPEGTIMGLVDRYLRYHETRVKSHQIKYSRLYGVRRGLVCFTKWIGSAAYEPQGVRYKLTQGKNPHLQNFYKYLVRMIDEKELQTETAKVYWHDVKDMSQYAADNGWMPPMPSLVRRLKFVNKRETRTIEFMKDYEIHKLFQGVKERKNKVPMRLFMALALNCGYTQADIQDLKYEHILFYKGWAHSIQKKRTKTQHPMKHTLWKSTAFMLMYYLHEHPKQDGDTIFIAQNGKPYVQLVAKPRTADQSMTEMKIYIRDNIGNCFRRLVAKVFPTDAKGKTFRLLRKTGATTIQSISTNDSLLCEQLYLGHRPMSVARQHYTAIEIPRLDEVLIELEKHFDLDQYIPKRKQDYPLPPPNLYEGT